MTAKRPVGRPCKDPGMTRILISFRLHPECLEIVERLAAVLKISKGEAIDQMAYFYAMKVRPSLEERRP